VAQLEQILTAASSAHRNDESVVRIFGDLELTEQLNNATRSRIDAKLHLGPKTALALQLLADQSAFLDLPASDRTAIPQPDAPTQQHILNSARAYVVQMMPHLPDFIATRSTFRFDNSPQIIKENEWPVHAGLHLVGSSTREITLREDTAVPNSGLRSVTASAPLPNATPESGLRTSGEFGPILALVMLDTYKGKISFHHLEQTPGGTVAVYRYSVPKSTSHYTVDYCCIVDKAEAALRQGGRRGSGVPPPVALQDNLANHFHKMPAYHGSLVIDPVSGAILRITIQAELDIDGPVTRADILVEYGPVLIGDRKFICPVLSLALTQGLAGTNATFGIPPDMQINEVSFTNYHRLGTSIRIIPETGEASAPTLDKEKPDAQTTPAPASQPTVAPEPTSAPGVPPATEAAPG
jgi:hypothetical protein